MIEFGQFSSDILREIRTVDLEKHKPTHASALLVWYSKPTKNIKTVVELGSGTGIVSFALSKLYGLQVDGIELQKELFELSLKGTQLNELSEKVRFYNLDVRDVRKLFKPETYDMVVSNMPFHIGKESSDKVRKTTRSGSIELVESFVDSARYLLRNKGEFVFILSPKILVPFMNILASKRLNLQYMCIFLGKENSVAKLVLLRGKKNGGMDLTIHTIKENK